MLNLYFGQVFKASTPQMTMDEQILEDLFLGNIEAKDFLNTAFKRQYAKNGDFSVKRNHLLKLCDLTIGNEITAEHLAIISDYLIMSDYFAWDSDSTEGEVVSRTIFEWANSSINFEINDLNLNLWREYLQTGNHKLSDYNHWNGHIRSQKEICEKVNSIWQPVNPRHKIGVSDNLGRNPIQGLRHPPENGTTGWFIWTGEYLEADDFFKPIHAEHLLQKRPDLIKYLGLQPGYRFLVDDMGNEDIWEDKELLNLE